MDTIDWARCQEVRGTSAYPSLFNERRFTIKQLQEAAARADILFRGWPFIYCRPDITHVVGDGLETKVNNNIIRPHVEQWNLLRSGAFVHRTVMHELNYPEAQGKRVLDTMETILHIAEAIGSLWRLYEFLTVPQEEEITIEFTYEDTKDRELVVLDRRRIPLPPERRCYSPRIQISRTLPLGLWRASDVQIAAEMCAEIFQQFQWEASLQQLQQEIGAFLGRAPAATR